MKALTVFAILIFSFSTFAASKVNVLSLKAGDKLVGVDTVKNDVCTIIVMGDQVVNGKLEVSLEVKIGHGESQDFKIKEKQSALNKLLAKELSKERNEQTQALEVVEAFFRTNKLSKKSVFSIRKSDYYEHTYTNRNLIECIDLSFGE